MNNYELQLKKLYMIPDLYDDEYAALTLDIDFWVEYIRSNNIRSVLELGCGSGRIGCKLTEITERYVGIDFSPYFLESFRKKIGTVDSSRIVLMESNITNFELGETFDLVLLPFNTIPNLLSSNQVRNMLTCVKKHMHSGSQYIIDCFNPSLRFLISHNERTLRNSFVNKDGDHVEVYETNKYFSDTQINYINRIYINKTQRTEMILDMPMRIYYPLELDALLFYNGFNITKKFGDYDMSPFGADSMKQIIISEI